METEVAPSTYSPTRTPNVTRSTWGISRNQFRGFRAPMVPSSYILHRVYRPLKWGDFGYTSTEGGYRMSRGASQGGEIYVRMRPKQQNNNALDVRPLPRGQLGRIRRRPQSVRMPFTRRKFFRRMSCARGRCSSRRSKPSSEFRNRCERRLVRKSGASSSDIQFRGGRARGLRLLRVQVRAIAPRSAIVDMRPPARMSLLVAITPAQNLNARRPSGRAHI